jgi:hypothetical protein
MQDAGWDRLVSEAAGAVFAIGGNMTYMPEKGLFDVSSG